VEIDASEGERRDVRWANHRSYRCAAAPSVDPADGRSARDCEAPGPASARQRRILIVDDNVSLAENIAEILESQGYTTRTANTGEEALEAVLDDVGIVITDFRLPGINGAQLIVRLRLHRTALPALVISAHTDQVTTDAARAAGADFLPKPLDIAILSRFVENATSFA
jgi:DNA-binding NtrC family response regulator